MNMIGKMLYALVVILATPLVALAADASGLDSGDTAWVLISSALVLLMTPGVAFFYGGMVRKKNVVNTIMQVVVIMGIVSVQWVLYGYSLSFGPDQFHLFGGLDYFGFNQVGGDPFSDYAATIPHQAFAAFQMMFAIITVALVTGSIAERMRFPAFILFVLLWTTIVYDPLAHMVWGIGGWLRDLGALDFAGGTVVHISSGVSGLIAAVVLGKRFGYKRLPMLPHHLPMATLGAALLWFGWFGFNAGSALAANGLAAQAFMTTNTAAGAAALAWVVVEWIKEGKPTLLGAISGLVAGLVIITPAAGFVSTVHAIIMGLIGGVVCKFAVAIIKNRTNVDDSLDAFGIHGVGGTLGALLTGVFASKAVNPAGADGLLFGNPEQLLNQVIAVVATYALAIVGTWVILKVISLVTPLTVKEEEQQNGLDHAIHGQPGYNDFGVGDTISSVTMSTPAGLAETVGIIHKG